MLYDPPAKNDTPKTIFNPSFKDIEVDYLDDNNKPTHYSLKSLMVGTYPEYLANWIINKIVDQIQNERNIAIMTEDKYAEILSEIKVDL